MSKNPQPWWQMRTGFKIAAGITAAAFLALLLSFPTQSDASLYRTEVVKPPPTEAQIQAAVWDATEAWQKAERVGAAAYWADTGRHFEWSTPKLATTPWKGIWKFSGRIRNVGPRDASKVHIKVSMRDMGNRETGSAVVRRDDGLRSGESWRYDGMLTVLSPGGVGLYVGPESITASGYEEYEEEVAPKINRKKERVKPDYWSDPGRHFTIADLDYASPAQDVLTVSGRIKNVGERDASKLDVKVSWRDAQGNEVGRGYVRKHDGLASNASWVFDGMVTVKKPGGVELYVGPDSIVAY